MALLEDVKTALRINHTKLDSDIQDNIEAAKQEMIRAGVSSERVNVFCEDDFLIKRAIKTFCMMSYAIDQNQAKGYRESFECQMENLRKSRGYENDEDEE